MNFLLMLIVLLLSAFCINQEIHETHGYKNDTKQAIEERPKQRAYEELNLYNLKDEVKKINDSTHEVRELLKIALNKKRQLQFKA